MRTMLVGVAFLVLGLLAGLGYSHYLGEGSELSDLRARLADALVKLDKANQGGRQTQQETEAMAAQIQQLFSSKDALQKQVDDLKSQAAAAPVAASEPKPLAGNFMANMIKAHMDQQREQRFQMLKARLHLTPDQETALRAAMDAEAKIGADAATAMLNGGKFDPSKVAAFKSVDQTLNDILSPDQKTAYQALKTDEKNNTAESLATFQMNQVAPMLQLNDSQKDQMVSALEQVQLNTSDPAWLKTNVSNSADPTAILDAEQKARNDALTKILSPDQLATYEQQAQSQLNMQRQMMQQFHPGAGADAVSGATTSTPAPVNP